MIRNAGPPPPLVAQLTTLCTLGRRLVWQSSRAAGRLPPRLGVRKLVRMAAIHPLMRARYVVSTIGLDEIFSEKFSKRHETDTARLPADDRIWGCPSSTA